VEKIMKEVDPGGFSERRPKWKTVQEMIHTTSPGFQTYSISGAAAASHFPSHNSFLPLPVNDPTTFPHTSIQVQAFPVSSYALYHGSESTPQLLSYDWPAAKESKTGSPTPFKPEKEDARRGSWRERREDDIRRLDEDVIVQDHFESSDATGMPNNGSEVDGRPVRGEIPAHNPSLLPIACSEDERQYQVKDSSWDSDNASDTDSETYTAYGDPNEFELDGDICLQPEGPTVNNGQQLIHHHE
jgi:hypothetical protein